MEKATIKCYKGNATAFYLGNFYDINWDGMEWDNEEEWNEWADEELSAIKGADNYEDVKRTLLISTSHRIKS